MKSIYIYAGTAESDPDSDLPAYKVGIPYYASDFEARQLAIKWCHDNRKDFADVAYRRPKEAPVIDTGDFVE